MNNLLNYHESNEAFVSVMMAMIEDYAKAVHDGADDHAANLRHVVKSSLEQIPQPSRFLQELDQELLRRFIETAEDDESFDIGMPAVKRLADLGVVRNCGFGRYAVTMFGCWVHEHYGYQNPPLPLKTNADRDAAQRAKLTAQSTPHP